MFVINEVKGDTYKKLIEYALDNCNKFSLFYSYSFYSYAVFNKKFKELVSKYDNINDQNMPQIIGKIKNSELIKDFCESHMRKCVHEINYEKIMKKLSKYQIDKKYSISEDYPNPGDHTVRGVTHFFKLDKSMKNFFLEKDGISDWTYYDNMEDLCFYIDDFCFLTSVTHEDMLSINCRDEKEYEYLKSIGIKFEEKKFVKTNDVFIS